MKLVLVDTGVFIDFFRGRSQRDDRLVSLLRGRRVTLSPLVKLELLVGVRKDERRMLEDTLSPLPLIEHTHALMELAIELVPIVRRTGLCPGIPDYLIAIEALSCNLVLYSGDSIVRSLGQALGVDVMR
jgi:predicted nucleic acid-binding protein